MRLTAVVGTSVLGLLLGTTTPARAQHDHEDEGHGDSQKHHGDRHEREHGRSAGDQHSDRHEGNAGEKRREHHSQGNGREHIRESNRREHEQHSGPRDVWQGHRAKNWQHEHHGWHERGGYRGYRIPDDRFHANFGRGHWFRVRSNPIIVVGGYPRFQYGGFWFSVVDPWPEYWSRTWYDTDDVYVDYVNDGYYMYNRRHPGVGIAVNVSF
jgi:hypothetical protein